MGVVSFRSNLIMLRRGQRGEELPQGVVEVGVRVGDL